jgi:hypothetical protein
MKKNNVEDGLARIDQQNKSLESRIFEELTKKKKYGKPLIVIHPGFSMFFNFLDSKSEEYRSYICNLKREVNEAVSGNKCVLIIYVDRPPEIETKTKELFDNLRNVMWVPDPFVLRVYEKLSKYVKEVDIAGERGCLETHENILKGNKIKVNQLEDCVFIPYS